MQQFRALWSELTVQRRILVAGATIATFAAIVLLARMAANPQMSLLYAGLEPEAAGEVVQTLEGQGIDYDIRGGAIFVPAARRDALRMTLASDGLPANGTDGYELLDSLSGFGTTSQMFDAAYWRAKEGELARTIVASPAIQTARVHIAKQSSRPFRRDVAPTASITVTAAAGGIDGGYARALRYLVASAVAGLSPEDVSVIDARGGTILSVEEPGPAARGDQRAEALKRNVERLLEARVGPGRAVVEVSVETATEREQITERRIEPDSRVAISQETEQSSSTSRDSGGAGVTVASNLPDGDGAEGEGTSVSESTESQERVNYEVSELQREVVRAPGDIRRLSVAVLLDGIRTVSADGTPLWEPRTEEEMQALRELVASAVGFDEARGDKLTLKTMEFEPRETAGTPPESSMFAPTRLDPVRIAQVGVLALVALVLGLFVVRPILAGGRRDSAAQLAPPDDSRGALTGELDDDLLPPGGLQLVSAFDDNEEEVDFRPSPDDDPVNRLRRLLEERQTESLEILRQWMEDDEGKA